MPDDLIDEAGKESFPASDPPAFHGTAATPGPGDASGRVDDRALDLLLNAMERALLAPIVSGELARWSETACQACAEAVKAIAHCTSVEYPQEIRAIAHDDPELASRAAQMLNQSAALGEQAQQFLNDMEQVCKTGGKNQPDEAPLRTVAQSLSSRGVELALQVRRLDEEILTWQHESLNRDRGNVD